ncbi:flagellar hook protein FlgE [Natronincola peptidivorans]|uniref:Flagellar hook protein FlgE n=1 Tax=Natronincola peptidivorans TaxID=426128 RepID=A0A1H9YGE3_9FIRM|nr:flagellar hook protein FlgE [Natronincola peptidivorans]SES67537.1 flagellar hook protein FlgE [Natronincola peptidivorans]
MMRSMFSAVSGLKAHQLRMDVIGNNIANVNTVGYKGSRVTFQEVFSQTLRGAGAPQAGRGGTNPQQVGLGINVASMDTFHIRGAVERTDYNTDLMINGEGFFIVSNDANFLNRSYTRAGSFALDEAGNLVTPEGLRVLGYMYDAETGRMGTAMEGLQISRGMSYPAMSTGVPSNNDGTLIEAGATIPNGVTFDGNLNADTKVYAGAAGTPPTFTIPAEGADGYPLRIDDLLDDDNKSAVARDTTFTVYDELGGTHEVRLAFVKVAPNRYEVCVVNKEGVLSSEVPPHTILFDSNGKIIDDDANGNDGIVMTLVRRGEGDPPLLDNGARPFTFNINLGQLTQFSNESDASASDIRGFKQGSLDTFAIDSNGVITGYFTNGQMRPVGQVALANFRNPAGLEKAGNNLYRVTPNSGEPLVGNPGTGGRGALNPGALEMSNVDLSREFTDMITTQRGFQANSRIITTSDEMLQEVVNMKR